MERRKHNQKAHTIPVKVSTDKSTLQKHLAVSTNMRTGILYKQDYCCCCCLVASGVSDCATLSTAAWQVPLFTGFSMQEHWRGLPWPPPGYLHDLGMKPWSAALQADSLLLSHQRSPSRTTTLMFSKRYIPELLFLNISKEEAIQMSTTLHYIHTTEYITMRINVP